jgi:hypothetical protein
VLSADVLAWFEALGGIAQPVSTKKAKKAPIRRVCRVSIRLTMLQMRATPRDGCVLHVTRTARRSHTPRVKRRAVEPVRGMTCRYRTVSFHVGRKLSPQFLARPHSPPSNVKCHAR